MESANNAQFWHGGTTVIDYSRINYGPLTAPDDPAAFREFKRWAKASRQPWASSAGQIVAVVAVSFAGFLVLTLISTFIGGIVGAVTDSPVAGVVSFLAPGAVLLAIGIPLTIQAANGSGAGGRWERWYRLHHFAEANRMRWHASSDRPNYPGTLFQLGSSRAAYDHLTSTDDRYLDIGNYRYTTGSGKSQTTHHMGFMALKLDRRIPHCVLDAESNNSIFGSNMPLFDKRQILRLEGDFNTYFTLYCPREYERDALYIFTPDLMALLIDNVSAFDVEIVDDWMFVYSTTPWDSENPWVWYRLFSIVHTVGRKTLDRTEYYRDDRAMPALAPGALPAPPNASNNVVAPEGQRLKKRVNWIPLVVLGAVFLLPGVVLVVGVFVGVLSSL